MIITKGLKVAYADFDVAFQDFARAIHGPREDAPALMFLAAYLRSPLARYYLFHTAAVWGVERTDVRIDEIMQIPFMLPDAHPDRRAAHSVMSKVASAMRSAADMLTDLDRSKRIVELQEVLRPLIEEYFGVDDTERKLIADTHDYAMASATPSSASAASTIPTVSLSSPGMRAQYASLLCDTLNDWSKRGPWQFVPEVHASSSVAVVAVSRGHRNESPKPPRTLSAASEQFIEQLFRLVSEQRGVFTWARGVKIFIDDRLYILKPLARRFWTQTAALNDADEILQAILRPAARTGDPRGVQAIR